MQPMTSRRRVPLWAALTAAVIAGLLIQVVVVAAVAKVRSDDDPPERGRMVAVGATPAFMSYAVTESWTGGVGDVGQSRTGQARAAGVIGLGGSSADLRLSGTEAPPAHVVVVDGERFVRLDRPARLRTRWARVRGDAGDGMSDLLGGHGVALELIEGGPPEEAKARIESVSKQVTVDGRSVRAEVDVAKLEDVTGVNVMEGAEWPESGPATIKELTLSAELDDLGRATSVRFVLSYAHPDDDEHRLEEQLTLTGYGKPHRIYEPHPSETVPVPDLTTAMAMANGLMPVPGDEPRRRETNPLDLLRGLFS